MRALYFILLFTSVTISSFAGKSPKLTLEQFESLPLYVIRQQTENENASLQRAFNNDIEKIVNTFWDLNKSIQYLDVEELPRKFNIKEVVETNQDFLALELHYVYQSGFYLYVWYSKHDKAPIFTKYLSWSNAFEAFELEHYVREFQIDIKGKLANDKMAKAGSPLKRANLYAKKNNPKLKDKTLLILEGSLPGNLTTTTIRGIYPNKFEIVELEKIEQALYNRDPQYAYVFYFPQGAQVIYDAETGEIMGYSRMSKYTGVNEGRLDAMRLNRFTLRRFGEPR